MKQSNDEALSWYDALLPLLTVIHLRLAYMLNLNNNNEQLIIAAAVAMTI